VLFIGLDLAWGQKNTSGGVVLRYEGDGPAAVVDVQEALGDDEAILGWIDEWDRERQGILIGVDAPLWVPNLTGKRFAEAEVGRRFARFQAGAHPANRTLFKGYVRGEELVEKLAARRIVHDPYLTEAWMPKVRRVMEVFPHPAHVILFGLPRTLKYKAKPGRDYPSRWAAMNEYTRLLRSLRQSVPPLSLSEDWPPIDVTGLRGIALKHLEDALDALTCAYIVLWYWHHGSEGGEVIGDMPSGYIVVPRPPKTEPLISD
jgi:predicted RNase H-like nuclease